MKYFWNMVTGQLAKTNDAHTVLCLLMNGYVEIEKEEYLEIAKEILT